MVYSKPQVTIDLEEYNELKRIKASVDPKTQAQTEQLAKDYYKTLQTMAFDITRRFDPQLLAKDVLTAFPLPFHLQ